MSDWRKSLEDLKTSFEADAATNVNLRCVMVQTPHGAIHGKRATPGDLEAYVPVLVREFGRYPKEFVERMGLKRIVLCRSLAFIEQPRAAVPHFGGKTMYLDAESSMTD